MRKVEEQLRVILYINPCHPDAHGPKQKWKGKIKEHFYHKEFYHYLLEFIYNVYREFMIPRN